ncbi:MAG: sigma-54 dependent transcriptional regulator [Treponema sp.]|nr:sigma-54 dependent transcriptional regulator [Treponema sp.]
MRILIVDDEKNIRLSLKKYLALEKIDSVGVESGESALVCLEKEAFDAVAVDLKLPGMSGQDMLEWMQQRGIAAPVLMMSAHGEIADAVQALKSGAKDYLVKPFDPAEFIIKLQALVKNKRLEDVAEAEKRTSPIKTGIIGHSEIMRNISMRIDKLAATNVTVLITGESGTGKEVAAREIHDRGNNSAEPFIAINIGGINENLMESELFGHEKGSFTGAVGRKMGLFELAGRGTIFLDEIGEMPLPLQVKLLRVLQERKIRRLGGMNDIQVNARIVSATNRRLETMIQEERFREDLFYRLNVFRLELPPLRERSEDIPLLADFLLKKAAFRMGREMPLLSPDALDKLRAYSFPGNIRELENILERALIYGDDQIIKARDIELHEKPAPLKHHDLFKKGAAASIGLSLEDIEKQAILESLARNHDNRTKVAEELGVTRKTILNKIKLYGLEER